MNFGISDKSYALILSTLKKIPTIKEDIIFGSRAMGNYKQGSDIDITIIARLETILNQELPMPYKINIVYYRNNIDLELKKYIDEKEITIYKRSDL